MKCRLPANISYNTESLKIGIGIGLFCRVKIYTHPRIFYGNKLKITCYYLLALIIKGYSSKMIKRILKVITIIRLTDAFKIHAVIVTVHSLFPLGERLFKFNLNTTIPTMGQK